MANILDLLKKIKEARYGKDVRNSIHDAILQCYEDGKAGAIDLEARQELEKIASPTQLGRIKIDGTTITIDENGVIHGAAQVPEGVLIGSGEVVEIELPPIVAHKAYVDSLDNNIAEQFSVLKDTTRQLNNTINADHNPSSASVTISSYTSTPYIPNVDGVVRFIGDKKWLKVNGINMFMGTASYYNALYVRSGWKITVDEGMTALFFPNNA